MRVVAGVLSGRRIATPAGTAVRPTTDRVREAVFNSLGSLDLIEGAVVADLFAGSGALGIEALSRGAAHCTFVERDRSVSRVIAQNLEDLGVEGRSRLIVGDALIEATRLDADLVLADPPYDFDDWPALLDAIDASHLVAEAERPVEPEDSAWRVIRAKRYGRTWVSILERVDVTSASDGETS